MRIRMNLCAAALAGIATLCVITPGAAKTPVDRAAIQIDVLDRALQASAQANSTLDRAAALTPAVAQTFNIEVMAAFVVGPAWATTAEHDRAIVSRALGRYMVARLGNEFAGSTNVSFAIDPVVQVRGADKLVRTVVSEAGSAPAHLDYRLREYAGAWKVIDIYYNGVGELTTQRADLASTVATSGVAALSGRLDAMSARLEH